MSALRPPLGPDLTIGIVGPHEMVERVMLTGTSGGAAAGGVALFSGTGTAAIPSRLVAAAYRDEQEAADKVQRLGSTVDVCLFASQVPYEWARKAGALTMPATYVPLNGAALHGALLRVALDPSYDLARLSIDILARSDVEETYADLGVSTQDVHVREEASSAAGLAAFHERLWRRGVTTVALTCMHSVADRLSVNGIPVLRIRPPGAAIRTALQTAALLGAHHRLEEAQLAVVVVDIPTLRETIRRGNPRYWREELRLAVHRMLVQEAQRLHAAVAPIDDHSFLMTATRGSLAVTTEGFRIPPFVERARVELGVTIEVGIGMGRTAQDAEGHARAALIRAQSQGKPQAFAVDREGRALVPPPRVPPRSLGHGPSIRPKGVETLTRLAEKLAGGDAPFVVDAETAGRLLTVTPRTARRLLRTLVEEGLAWPLPPNRSPQPGRPRQLYRLIVEKLETGSPH